MVEDLFRTMKSILETRPIYHKRDETIRGTFLQLSGLLLQRRCSRAGGKRPHLGVGRNPGGLDNLQEVEGVCFRVRFILPAR